MSETEIAPRWSAVAVASSGAFVAGLSTSLVAVAAPSMARDLHVSPADVGWVLSAYLLTISSLLAGVGRLADLFGRRRVYLAGYIVFGIASAACGVAPTLPLLIAARVVQGLGAASIMATGPAIITRAFPARLRARGLGLQLAATFTGLTLGPTIGGALTSALGWHAVFHAVAAAAFVGTCVAVIFLERDESRPVGGGPPLDVAGSVLFAVGVAALLIALRSGPASGGTFASVAVLLVISVAALVIFARHEARHPAPVLPLTLMRTAAFAFGVAGAMLLYIVVFVLVWLLPFHLQRERGMTPRHAGTLMTAQPAMMAIVAPFSGWLSDRFGPRLPSVAGMLLIAAGLALVGRAASSSDLRLVLALGVVGVGAGLYVAPNNAVIMAAAPRDRQGTASAIAATARNVGMTCGVALAVVLHERVGFEGALAAVAGIALLGALLGAVRPVSAS